MLRTESLQLLSDQGPNLGSPAAGYRDILPKGYLTIIGERGYRELAAAEVDPCESYLRSPSVRSPRCTNVTFVARVPSVVKMNRSSRSNPTPKVSCPR
jgi:hypothetical protein